MTLLLACFLLVSVHVPTSHGAPLPPTYNRSMCLDESFKCGGVDIHYPFSLASASSDNTANYSCGYTDLRIFCRDDEYGEAAIIELGQDEYRIKGIFYDNNTIIVADTVVVGDGCPIIQHNVTFDTQWLRYTGSYENLTFCSDCYQNEDVPTELREYQIHCNMFTGASFVFYPNARDLPRKHELSEHCSEISIAPVFKESLARMIKRYMLVGGIQIFIAPVIEDGFELAWSRTAADNCSRCESSGGRCAYSQNKHFMGCLCSNGKVDTPECRIAGNSKRTITYIVAITSSLLLLCLVILAFYLARKYGLLLSKTNDTPRIEYFLQKNGSIHPKRYTYTEVKRMTKSFAVKLGQGGFGAVYRGNLPDGREVAVKMLTENKGDGEEFMNEVASISRTSHVNVVTLLGFCLQGPKRALVYEYMPNGSLERYAFKNNFSSEGTFTWEKLFDISIGIARGLEYLHRGCNIRIVHFDIKPHNILLDQDFCPKISDFGLAKLCLNKESAISIAGARGTIGYIAPEVYSKQFGTISSKSDVYSYGMMVLEMVGARDKNNNVDSESSSQYFPQWIYDHLDEYCISASEIDGETTELVRKMIVVGLWCIQVTPTNRPTMTRVVEMLEGSTSNLEVPPKMLLS